MRAPGVLAVMAAALLAVAGCSDSHGNSPSAGHPAQNSDPSKKAPRKAEPAASSALALQLPQAAPLLVREVGGNGSRSIPQFQPGKDAYTVFAICSGSTSVTIHTVGGDDTNVACDGVETIGQVYPDPAPQRISIEAAEGTAWKFAVVSGAVSPQS